MKNKDRFEAYEDAWNAYYGDKAGVVAEYGATRMEWGFGRWLWMENRASKIENWRAMNGIGILTSDGRKRLARAEKAEVEVRQ